MSKETVIKVIDTTPPRTGEENNLPAFVKVATYHPHDREETKLILQRYLLTKIETIINRDEAIAVCKGLLQHFTISVDDLQSNFHTSIILVDGPQGCGKTKHADRIMKHFSADEYLEGDEFGALETLVGLVGKSKCVVVMTNRTGESLYQMRVKMRQAGLHVVSNHFNDVMKRIQAECDHDWQRRPCPDIHQPDYLHCRKCDATKEL